jgi:predicted site-specific integrase-resolvase
MKDFIEIGGKQYIPTTKVMQRLGIGSYKSLHVWVANGTLPCPIKLGRRLYIDKDEVEARLLALTQN